MPSHGPEGTGHPQYNNGERVPLESAMAKPTKTYLLDQPLFRLTERDPDKLWEAVLCEGEPMAGRDEDFRPAVNTGRQKQAGGGLPALHGWKGQPLR